MLSMRTSQKTRFYPRTFTLLRLLIFSKTTCFLITIRNFRTWTWFKTTIYSWLSPSWLLRMKLEPVSLHQKGCTCDMNQTLIHRMTLPPFCRMSHPCRSMNLDSFHRIPLLMHTGESICLPTTASWKVMTRLCWGKQSTRNMTNGDFHILERMNLLPTVCSIAIVETVCRLSKRLEIGMHISESKKSQSFVHNALREWVTKLTWKHMLKPIWRMSTANVIRVQFVEGYLRSCAIWEGMRRSIEVSLLWLATIATPPSIPQSFDI